jgi:hypothetical protein
MGPYTEIDEFSLQSHICMGPYTEIDEFSLQSHILWELTLR